MEAIQGDPDEAAARAKRDKQSINRLLRFALIGAVALSLVLLVLLATATSNTQYFHRAYQWLFWLTVAVTVGLFALTIELLRRLIQRYRRGLFGTRLMARMAASFSLMTLLPVLLIYLVAVTFVGRSIESWFDVPLERALESGLTMGRAALDTMRDDATAKARAMAFTLSETSESQRARRLQSLSSQNAVNDAALVSGRGAIVSTSGNPYSSLVPDLPDPEQIRRVRSMRLYAEFESTESVDGTDADQPALKLRVIVPVSGSAERPGRQQYLQLIEQVPDALAQSAGAIEAGRAGYQQLLESRNALKRLYRVTLTLIFLLTAFAAIAASFLLSGWLTGPLSTLAEGTRAVAEGDFRPVKDYASRSELGVLAQSFNAMTRQLEEARLQVDRNQHELEQVNARLESVLSNLTAGVLVLDSEFRLVLANQGAERVLGISTFENLDEPISEIEPLAPIADEIRQAFTEQAEAGAASWQRQFTLDRPQITIGENEPKIADLKAAQTIVARGSILPERRVGYVIVFDEITELISAQRANTWAEVARRLAHEIKNPLTPIQLSAERLQFKLREKLDDKDAQMLERSTSTIVNQVGALKLMVDEFREYARLPAARLEPLDLNMLIEDVLGLYQTSGSQEKPQAQLATELPMVLGDQTQLRQIVHNLVKNALEATESQDQSRIDIRTDRITTGGGQTAVRLTVTDNGPGFPPSLISRLFEPYVSSKQKGTGLGLAIVKKVADEHGARIEATNLIDESDQGNAANSSTENVRGARMAITFSKLAKTVDNTNRNELSET